MASQEPVASADVGSKGLEQTPSPLPLATGPELVQSDLRGTSTV